MNNLTITHHAIIRGEQRLGLKLNTLTNMAKVALSIPFKKPKNKKLCEFIERKYNSCTSTNRYIKYFASGLFVFADDGDSQVLVTTYNISKYN
jgi:hypothetical protein